MSAPKLSFPEEPINEIDRSLQTAALMYGQILYDGITETRLNGCVTNQLIFRIGTHVYSEQYTNPDSKKDRSLNLFDKAKNFILFALNDEIQELKLELGDIREKPLLAEVSNPSDLNRRTYDIIMNTDDVSLETLPHAFPSRHLYITFIRIGKYGYSQMHDVSNEEKLSQILHINDLTHLLIHHLLAQRLSLIRRLESPERNTQTLVDDKNEWNAQDSKKRKKGESDSD